MQRLAGIVVGKALVKIVSVSYVETPVRAFKDVSVAGHFDIVYMVESRGSSRALCLEAAVPNGLP